MSGISSEAFSKLNRKLGPACNFAAAHIKEHESIRGKAAGEIQ